MNLYDKVGNPITEIHTVLAVGKLFAIVELPNRVGENVVGLFIEDDGNYHLKCTFSSFWLDDLAYVAKVAFNTPENKG